MSLSLEQRQTPSLTQNLFNKLLVFGYNNTNFTFGPVPEPEK
jgi:hypothetical protein